MDWFLFLVIIALILLYTANGLAYVKVQFLEERIDELERQLNDWRRR